MLTAFSRRTLALPLAERLSYRLHRRLHQRLPRWFARFDSLLARMLLLSAAVLFAMHAGWLLLASSQNANSSANLSADDAAMRSTAQALRIVDLQLGATDITPPAARPIPALVTPLVTPLVKPLAPATLRTPIVARPWLVDLRPRFAVGDSRTNIGIDGEDQPGASDTLLRAADPADPAWVIAPVEVRSVPRALIVMLSMTSAILALSLLALSQWRPLRCVSRAMREFGHPHGSSHARRVRVCVHERGPREVRHLVSAFDDLQQRRELAYRRETLALASVAQHLATPLGNLARRTQTLAEPDTRRAFIDDLDSLGSFVRKLLEFAGEPASDDPRVSVHAFLRQRVARDARWAAQPIELALQAGERFALPRTVLDRLITNLVDNALEHGAPPVHVTTSRVARCWIIEVRDHGNGIAAHHLEHAMQPFVRLDPTRQRGDHCGLGLAIVARLAQGIGGNCRLDNHTDGGLHVTIELPFDFDTTGAVKASSMPRVSTARRWTAAQRSSTRDRYASRAA